MDDVRQIELLKELGIVLGPEDEVLPSAPSPRITAAISLDNIHSDSVCDVFLQVGGAWHHLSNLADWRLKASTSVLAVAEMRGLSGFEVRRFDRGEYLGTIIVEPFP